MVEVAANNKSTEEVGEKVAQSTPDSDPQSEQPKEVEDLQNVDLGEEHKKATDKDEDEDEDEDSVDLDAVEGEPVQEEPAKPAEPLIPGDIQGDKIKAYLSKRMEEDKEDSQCCDCTENKSTHANVSFGTFICSDCAKIHQENFSMFQNYIKPLDSECWDTYQITCLQLGGNKKLNDFLAQYDKLDCHIERKYGGSSAKFYRRSLCAQARNLPFDRVAPPKNIKEESIVAGEAIVDALNSFDSKHDITDSFEEVGKIIGRQFSKGWGQWKRWADFDNKHDTLKKSDETAAGLVVKEDIPLPAQTDDKQTVPEQEIN